MKKIFSIFLSIVFFNFFSHYSLFASENYVDAMKWYEQENLNLAPRQIYILALNAEQKNLKLKAIHYYREAAKQDLMAAKTRLGLILSSSPNKNNQVEARKWLTESITINNLNVILTLAWMHEFGIGGQLNLDEAQKLYKLAARLGSNKAFLSLANLSLRGIYGEPKIIEAMSYTILASRKDTPGSLQLFDQILPLIDANEWDEIEISIASLQSEINKIHINQ